METVRQIKSKQLRLAHLITKLDKINQEKPIPKSCLMRSWEVIRDSVKIEIQTLEQEIRDNIRDRSYVFNEDRGIYLKIRKDRLIYKDNVGEQAEEQKETQNVKRTINKLDCKSDRFLSLSKGVVSGLKTFYRRIEERHKNIEYAESLITFSQFVDQYIAQDGKCYYTKLEFTMNKGKKGLLPTNMSIDRINSSIGYTLGNTVFCCWFVNCAKNCWEMSDIIPLWKILLEAITTNQI